MYLFFYCHKQNRLCKKGYDMGKIVKIGLLLLAVGCLLFILLLSINAPWQWGPSYVVSVERDREYLKAIEDKINVFKSTGDCHGCDLGCNNYDEQRDLRQVVQAIRSKDLPINLYHALLQANLADADLSNADLSAITLLNSDLRGANLSNANLSSAFLDDVDLSGADLTGVNLRWAGLKGVNLQRANLTGANLQGALLFRTKLDGAILTGADLRGAVTYLTDLTDVDISHAKLDNYCMRKLRNFSYWLNFVFSTVPSGIKAIKSAIKIGCLYSQHWIMSKINGQQSLPIRTFENMLIRRDWIAH